MLLRPVGTLAQVMFESFNVSGLNELLLGMGIMVVAGSRLGLLTDIGSITPRVVAAFDGVDALLLECNHDVDMLASGPYPPSLQARVGGQYGHLNNAQAADFLRRIDHRRLRHLVGAHLSEKNNSPELVVATLGAVSEGLGDCLSLLLQDQASDWFPITA